jgi:hypothetical protein
MKKLVLIIAIAFTGLTAKAQVSQEGYFSVKENFIVWTKIYDTVPDLEAIKKNPLLEFTSEEGGMIKKSRLIPLTQRRLDEISGSFMISQKDGRYKVEVTNVREIPSTTIEVLGVSTTNSDIPIEKYNLDKNGQLKEFFLNHMSKPYDILFSSFFDPKKKKEDW